MRDNIHNFRQSTVLTHLPIDTSDPNIWTPVCKRLKKTAIPSQCLPNRTHDHQDLRRAQASAARAARASARDSHVMLPERSGISDLSSPPLAPSDGDTSTGMSAVEDDWHAAAFHTAPHDGETVPNSTMTDAEVAEVMLQLAGTATPTQTKVYKLIHFLLRKERGRLLNY
ncbi:hypothetical protein V5799_003557 [Amblyomma americanum]|uniref:Uncharacterized protein n=1 Tax=Amblyomma americanum TaxID=6943 RepID=A0AAQ4D8M1_AMBAM